MQLCRSGEQKEMRSLWREGVALRSELADTSVVGVCAEQLTCIGGVYGQPCFRLYSQAQSVGQVSALRPNLRGKHRYRGWAPESCHSPLR